MLNQLPAYLAVAGTLIATVFLGGQWSGDISQRLSSLDTHVAAMQREMTAVKNDLSKIERGLAVIEQAQINPNQYRKVQNVMVR